MSTVESPSAVRKGEPFRLTMKNPLFLNVQLRVFKFSKLFDQF